ncbi:GGDEF domain-containing protein [Veronia nyctiphanis]|uniref:diguanylate cyclase n=2 Tax=Veronia nyctiphanis TaxID=1278244 RepID=A0A4Q0YU59_9GAMM|nr:GGDEF domain-containing protein [Veronia nyctiphanis]
MQLEHAQLAFRDLSLKSRRETTILKRLLSRLIASHSKENSSQTHILREIKHSIDTQTDISLLIPQLAIAERAVIKYQHETDSHQKALADQIAACAEHLKSLFNLPAQLKRDVRQVMDSLQSEGYLRHHAVTEMLKLYDRAVRLLSIQKPEDLANSQHDIDRFHQLSSELQTLISGLDFEGTSGQQLLDIRKQLMLSPEPQKLLELTLTAMQLILTGTKQERDGSKALLNRFNKDLSELSSHTGIALEQANSLIQQREKMRVELASAANAINNGLDRFKTLEEARPELFRLTEKLASLSRLNLQMEQREERLIGQLKNSEQKLAVLSQETTEHRRRLGEQERKLLLDPLTKVYNRDALKTRLDHEYTNWLRYQTPLSMAMVDIDNFRQLNENYGHIVGDKILQVVARTIHQSVSKTDFIARFGGEEFIVLIPDSDKNDIQRALQTLCETVAKLPFKCNGERIKVTVSIGVSHFRDKDNPEIMQERVSTALSTAKSYGRDQVVWL